MYRRKKNNQIITIIILSIFLLTMISCNFPAVFSGKTPEPTLPPIPVSTEALGELDQNINKSEENYLETGRFELQLTESQITSYVSYQLDSSDNNSFQNPQLYLRDEAILILADFKQSGLSLPVKIEIKPFIDGNGGIDYIITSSSIGLIPLPKSMIVRIQNYIEDSIGGDINSQLSEFYIDGLTITNGLLTVTGHKR